MSSPFPLYLGIIYRPFWGSIAGRDHLMAISGIYLPAGIICGSVQFLIYCVAEYLQTRIQLRENRKMIMCQGSKNKEILN